MQLPAGIISDWIGERTLLIVSLSLTGVSVLLFATTVNYVSLLLATGLFGIGSGLYGTPQFSLLSKVFDERNATVFGLASATGNVGASVLPLVASMIAVAVGWRHGFGVIVPFIVIVVGCLWWFVYRPGGQESTQTPLHAVTDIELVWGSLLHWVVVLILGGIILMAFIYQGVTAFLPTYLTSIKDLSQSTVGTLYGLFFLVGAVTQPTAGYVADWAGPRVTLISLSGGTAAMLMLLPFVDGLVGLAILTSALGVQMGVGPVCSAQLLSILPEEIQATSYGLLRTIWFGLGSAAPFVIGFLADSGRFDEAFMLFGAIALAALALFTRFPRHPVEDAPTSGPSSGEDSPG
jgi:MFS family permease